MNSVLFWIFVSFVPTAVSEVCYYNDGDGYVSSTVCPGGCCGAANNSCCLDSGAIIAILVGIVVTIFLLIFCAVVCCVERKHSRRYLLNRERRIQRLEELANLENNRILSINGEVDMPPRYSDLFPRNNQSSRSSDTARISNTDSEGRRSLTSLSSLLRLSFGRNRSSSSGRRANHELLTTEQSAHSIGTTEHTEHIPRETITDNEHSSNKCIDEDLVKQTSEPLQTVFENDS